MKEAGRDSKPFSVFARSIAVVLTSIVNSDRGGELTVLASVKRHTYSIGRISLGLGAPNQQSRRVIPPY